MQDKIIKIYTDGGCRGNQSDKNIGAWGAYLVCGDKEKKISGFEENTTNNRMELKGAIEGLKCVNPKFYVELYLDSNYVLQGLDSWINNWKKNNWKTSTKKDVLNKDLWIELDEIKSKFTNIKLIKVKGHSGNYGNEVADKLCNDEMDKYGGGK